MCLYILCHFEVHYIQLVFSIRHTGEMIKKLHSAGLGFYVRETDTKQKLG